MLGKLVLRFLSCGALPFETEVRAEASAGPELFDVDLCVCKVMSHRYVGCGLSHSLILNLCKIVFKFRGEFGSAGIAR